MTDGEPVQISGSSVYRYAEELIVELTGVDGDGDFVVLSYQFDYTEESVVTPKQSVEQAHVDVVASGLDDAGYEWPRSDA